MTIVGPYIKNAVSRVVDWVIAHLLNLVEVLKDHIPRLLLCEDISNDIVVLCRVGKVQGIHLKLESPVLMTKPKFNDPVSIFINMDTHSKTKLSCNNEIMSGCVAERGFEHSRLHESKIEVPGSHLPVDRFGGKAKQDFG